jgi:hypothetical protein
MSEEFVDAAMVEEAEVVPTQDGEKKVDDKATLDEPDVSFIGAKVAKTFNGLPYIGEIIGAKNTKEGPLYKVLYRDNDREEFTTEEAQTYRQDYIDLQASMWKCMLNLVEDLNVDTLKNAGINTISDLELFGGIPGGGGGGTPFDSLDLSLKTKQQVRVQVVICGSVSRHDPSWHCFYTFPLNFSFLLSKHQLYVIATYLLNDQILSDQSKLDEMARFNLAKATGKLKTPRQPRTGNSTTARPSSGEAKKPRGRPKKAVNAGTVVKKSRGRPKKTISNSSTVTAGEKIAYSGSPKDSIQEITDWPEGWNLTIKERKDGHLDRYWSSPGGNTFRSELDVRKFLVALGQTSGDETEAMKSYKRMELSS